MVPNTTLTAAAISAVPKLISNAFSVRRSVAILQKSAHPSAAERHTRPDSGIRMTRNR